MTAWMYEGNGGKLMREFYAKYNIVNFPGGNTGAQMGGWYRKEVKSAADIKGLKFRVGGFAGKVIERMGGVPQNIPGGEIYTALWKKARLTRQSGSVLTMTKNWASAKWLRFTTTPVGGKAVPRTGLLHQRQSLRNSSVCLRTKPSLSAAAAYAHVEMQAKYDARNPKALKELVGAKVKVMPFPKDVLDLAFKESMALYAEISAKNPNWKKVYDDYAAFRKDQNLWFRFTEARFDSFMQAQKL